MTSLDQIELPDGSNYNLSVPFIVGTGSTAGTWLGALDSLTAYYDGLLILYKPSVAGASTTTLNINSIGAKTVYINSNSKLTTQFPANQPILLSYSTSQNSGCWMCVDMSNTPIGEASGAIATFDDGSSLPMRDLIVDIEPVQDLHGYDYPYPAGTSANILKPVVTSVSSNNITVTCDANGKVTITGTAEADTQIELLPFQVTEPGYYSLILKNNISGGDNTWWISMSGVGVIKTGDFGTFNFATAGVFKIRINVKSGIAPNAVFYPMIAKTNVKIPYTPYSNICPISGWTGANITRTGKNLFDKNTTVPNKRYTSAGVEVTTSSMCHSDFIRVIPLTSYYGLFNGTKDIYGAVCFDKNKQPLNLGVLGGEFTNHVFTAPENCYYVALNIGYNNNNLDDVCLNVSNQADDGTYFPSLCKTYNVTWQTEAGTVYGGTLNVITGLMVVKWVNKFLKDFDFSIQNRNPNIGGVYFKTNISSSDKAVRDNDVTQLYSHGTVNNPYNFKGNYSMAFNSINNIFVGFADDMNINTQNDFDTWVTNNPTASICYELATPIEVQLTPTQVNTLLGNNNIFADTGDILKAVYIRSDYDAFTDMNVLQTPTTSEAYYEVLFSGSTDNTEHTEGVRKSNRLKFNPSTKNLDVGDLDAPYLASSSPQINVVEKYSSTTYKELSASADDITLDGTSNTWDGTNTSLKSALAAKTDTTYTLAAGTGTDANKIVLTPSSGSAQKITVPYATSAGSATDSTKLPLTGGNMTGTIFNDNGEFWARNANDQTQYIRMGYADILYNKKWANYNTSLNTTLSDIKALANYVNVRNLGRSWINISNHATYDISHTGTGYNNLLSLDNVVGHTGNGDHTPTFFFIFYARLKTNKNTSTLLIRINGTTVACSAVTNSTSFGMVIGTGFANLNEGNNNVSLCMTAQDSSTTVTLAGYNTYGFMGIEL